MMTLNLLPLLHNIHIPLIDIVPSGNTLESIKDGVSALYWKIEILCYGFAAILGLVGGLRIYQHWQIHNHHHVQINFEIFSWFSACLFFLLAAAFVEFVLM
jgi:hypothetical protein